MNNQSYQNYRLPTKIPSDTLIWSRFNLITPTGNDMFPNNLNNATISRFTSQFSHICCYEIYPIHLGVELSSKTHLASIWKCGQKHSWIEFGNDYRNGTKYLPVMIHSVCKILHQVLSQYKNQESLRFLLLSFVFRENQSEIRLRSVSEHAPIKSPRNTRREKKTDGGNVRVRGRENERFDGSAQLGVKFNLTKTTEFSQWDQPTRENLLQKTYKTEDPFSQHIAKWRTWSNATWIPRDTRKH